LTLFALLAEAATWFIETFGLIGILITMAAESCLIPLPSEVVMPFAGYVAWRKSSWTFILEATLIATLGNLIGSIILYYIGVYLGRPFAERYGKYFLLTRDKLEMAEEWFRRYGAYSVFIGRMTPAIRTVISLPAGMFKLSKGKFIILTFTGSIPWNFSLTYIGYLLGPHWTILITYSTYIDIIGVILLIAAVIILYVKPHKHPSQLK